MANSGPLADQSEAADSEDIRTRSELRGTADIC